MPRNSAQTAARASLIAPLIALMLSCLLGVLRSEPNQDPKLAGQLAIISAAAFVLLILVGIVAGIAALTLMKKHGRTGVLAPAISGLAINFVAGALLVASALVIRQMLQHRQDLQRFQATSQELVDQTRKGLAGDKTAATQSAALLNAAGQEAEQSAQSAHGEERAVMIALAKLIQQEQPLLVEYQQVTSELMTSGGLLPKGITTVADLDHRAAILDHWDRINDAMDKALQAAPGMVAAELNQIDAPPEHVQRAVDLAKSKLNLDLNIAIRADDRQVIKIARDLFALYRAQWGNWHYDPASKRVLFVDPAALDQFNQLIAQARQVVAHQHQAQQELAQHLISTPQTPAAPPGGQ